MTRKPLQGRPGGRPRKDDPSLRSEWLRARVRPDELHRIEQLARDAGKTPSEYVRDAALTAQILIKRYRTVEPIYLHDLYRLSQEFSRVGNNVNQIATVLPTPSATFAANRSSTRCLKNCAGWSTRPGLY